MLACVCRPVTSTLPKPPALSAPQKRPTSTVVTCEPRTTSDNRLNNNWIDSTNPKLNIEKVTNSNYMFLYWMWKKKKAKFFSPFFIVIVEFFFCFSNKLLAWLILDWVFSFIFVSNFYLSNLNCLRFDRSFCFVCSCWTSVCLSIFYVQSG